VLILDLDAGLSLVVHLKMTGQLIYRPADYRPDDCFATTTLSIGPVEERLGGATLADLADGLPVGALPGRTTRVILPFEDRSRLFFNDQRRFGWIRLLPTAAVTALPLIAKMGPEPLGGNPWPEFLARIRRHQRSSVKACLLDQQVVAGIGNIYADEALWTAKIHPSTPVAELTDRQLRNLLDAVHAVMEQSLKLGGSTARDYVNAEGKRGDYLDVAKVFRRQGQLCVRCTDVVIKTRLAGRGTHSCPTCQPPPKRIAKRPSPPEEKLDN
jgi:formamidopyrimidine-DNA glycosylase